jgi:hypothetical protein
VRTQVARVVRRTGQDRESVILNDGRGRRIDRVGS